MPGGPGIVTRASVLWRRDLGAGLLGALLIGLWELSGLDMWTMRSLGNAHGFSLRDAWWTSSLLHEGGRVAGAVLLGALALDAFRFHRRGPAPAQRWYWLAATLVCLLLVQAIKRHSPTSCPWDLAEFGGHAAYLSHWRLSLPDGGGGKCFPSGHASVAFAFFSGYFLWRGYWPAAAQVWLVVVALAGMVFGFSQIVRGAHFPSHVFWTGWWCWMTCALLAIKAPASAVLQHAPKPAS